MEHNMNMIIYFLIVFVFLIAVYCMIKIACSFDGNKHKKNCKCLDCNEAKLLAQMDNWVNRR